MLKPIFAGLYLRQITLYFFANCTPALTTHAKNWSKAITILQLRLLHHYYMDLAVLYDFLVFNFQDWGSFVRPCLLAHKNTNTNVSP